MQLTRRGLVRALTACTATAGVLEGPAPARTVSATPADDSPIDFLRRDHEVRVQEVDYDGPTDREQRVFASVVGHTGPQRIAGVPDEVRYTVVLGTMTATTWVDRNGESVARSDNVEGIRHRIDYPGDTVRTSFPRDEDWVGGARLGETGEDPLSAITDDSTLLGTIGDAAWGVLQNVVPFLGAIVTAVDFFTDLANLKDDQSRHTVTFPFEEPTDVVHTYRMFEVTMNRRDSAQIDVRTRIQLDDGEYDGFQFGERIELDPDSFVSDVEGHPFERSIRELVDHGIISGYPDGTFRPERSVTRAEYATMLAEGFDPHPDTRPDFSDIDGHWAESAIRRVAGAGFFGGYPDGTFRPDRNVSKVEVLVALAGGLGYEGGDPSALSGAYQDAAAIPSWARDPVADVHATWGSIPNYPDADVLEPNRDATRAEAARYTYEGLTTD